MAKRALLVGCNYPGTKAELRGCINDVLGAKAMLTQYFGFQDSDITVMIDTDQQFTQPTGRNVKAKLSELVQMSVDGDLLVFHFSGHGTQVPSDNNDESDGKDEAICPCDMNVITDDDLREILKPLASKPGVKFTFIADCCHSGTLLDHDEVVITGPKPGGPPPPAIDIQAIQGMLASLGAKDAGNREFKNRALPTQDWMAMLSQMLGQPVQQGNVRSGLTQLFGADASSKAQQYVKYAQMAQQMLAKFQGGNGAAAGAAGTKTGEAGGGGGIGGIIAGLLSACLSQPAVNQPSATAGGVPAAGGAAPAPPVAGAKPPADQRLPDDVGILITGCQSAETSADACPSGDPAKAHGALSNALQTVVKTHHEQNPGQPLTYRNLVIGVREALAKTGFTQNPCLECSQKQADSAFILAA